MAPASLQDQASAFAADLTAIAQATFGAEVSFGTIQRPTGAITIGPVEGDKVGKFIPLVRKGDDAEQPCLWLTVNYSVSLDDEATYLMVRSSTFGLWVNVMASLCRNRRPTFISTPSRPNSGGCTAAAGRLCLCITRSTSPSVASGSDRCLKTWCCSSMTRSSSPIGHRPTGARWCSLPGMRGRRAKLERRFGGSRKLLERCWRRWTRPLQAVVREPVMASSDLAVAESHPAGQSVHNCK